ncbi:MAG: hypothetical protein EZS28_035009 [Streblomastix strix]|uniref:Uncharacterized protein n=1 Tax=Streblomastix strix TaxID=222440 RepID=A0A5J4UGV3_9EUKA|nr:MAG: hypothetical protein EZS28_035009 [Streblomastix strix]
MIYYIVNCYTLTGYTSVVVNVPLGFMSTYLPNKYRTDNPCPVKFFGSTVVMKLFDVGQYNRINPIIRYAQLTVVSNIQQ